MKAMELYSSRVFLPSRPIGGIGDASSDLFTLEGSTDFVWFDADQEESFWAPQPARQTEQQILPPATIAPSVPAELPDATKH